MFGTCIPIQIDTGNSYRDGDSSLQHDNNSTRKEGSKFQQSEHNTRRSEEKLTFQRGVNRTCNITKVSSVDVVGGNLTDGEYGDDNPFELMSLSRIGEDSYCVKVKVKFFIDHTQRTKVQVG